MNTIADKTVMNKLIVANWKLGRDETKLIETGSRQDRTVLSAVSTSHKTLKNADGLTHRITKLMLTADTHGRTFYSCESPCQMRVPNASNIPVRL